MYSHNKGSSDVISRSYGTLIHFNCAYQLEMEISLRKGVNVQDWNDFLRTVILNKNLIYNSKDHSIQKVCDIRISFGS